mmetsp:Transcript_66084/g.158060  ORF Transcript_66084/g.158060 Transcript_66084/m.158060 type:complete len:272 (+) Transcript_66084:655-1470(+)
MMIGLQGFVNNEPTVGDAFLVRTPNNRSQVLFKHGAELFDSQLLFLSNPLDVAVLEDLINKPQAAIIIVEALVVLLVVLGDFLGNLLQGNLLVDLQRGLLLEVKLELVLRYKFDELEHCAQQDVGHILIRNGVSAYYGGVDIHNAYAFLPGLCILVDNAEKVVLVLHGIKNVGLDQNVVVLIAVMDQCMAGISVTLEAVVAFLEINELPCVEIPKVANTWALLRPALLHKVQVVIKEEDSNLVLCVVLGNCWNDFGRAIYLFHIVPNREAR